jgi:hypothetical protein
MAISITELDYLRDSLRLVTGATGPVEPGQLVEAKVLSSLSELSGVDTIGPVAAPLSRPVKLEVSWRVFDHAGAEVHMGKDFVANNGLTGPVVDFVLKPPIVELTRSPDTTVVWKLVATVKVTAPGVAADPKDLEVPVELVQLAIPKFVALFRHRYFAAVDDDLDPGFVLFLVPWHSILQGVSEPLNDLLVRLDHALRPLRSLVGIAAFLTGIDTLRHALASQPMVRLRRGSAGDLENVGMRVETFLGIDFLNRDMRASDRVSSMIVMGPCGTRVGFYDDENFSLSGGEWAFNLVVGPEMVTIVRDLSDGKPPPTFPEEDPAFPLTRRLFIRQMGGVSFDGHMTSVEFDVEPSEEEKEKLGDGLCLPVVGEPGPI